MIKLRAWHKLEEGIGEVLFISYEHGIMECRMINSKYNKTPFRLLDRMDNWKLLEVK